MNTAKEMSDRIVQVMKDTDMSVTIVTDAVGDSIETLTDLDVVVGRHIYNVRIEVIRFSKGD